MKMRKFLLSVLSVAGALVLSVASLISFGTKAKAEAFDTDAFLDGSVQYISAEQTPGVGLSVQTGNNGGDGARIKLKSQSFGADEEVSVFFSVPVYNSEDINPDGTVASTVEPEGAYDVWPPDINKYARKFTVNVMNQNGPARGLKLDFNPNQTQITADGMLCTIYDVLNSDWTIALDGKDGEYYTRVQGVPTEEVVYGLKFSHGDSGNISVWNPTTESWVAPELFNQPAVSAFFKESTSLNIDFLQWIGAEEDASLKVIVKKINDVDLTAEFKDETLAPVITIGAYEKYNWKGETYFLPSFSAIFGDETLSVEKKAYAPDGTEVSVSADGKIDLDQVGEYRIVFSAQPLNEGDFNVGDYDRTIKIYSLDETKKFDATVEMLDELCYNWAVGEEYWDERGFTATDTAIGTRGSSLTYDFDCTNDEIHTLTFSMPLYDNEGNLLPTAANKETYGVDYPDILIRNAEDHNKYLRIRMTDTYTAEEETTLNLVYSYNANPDWKDRYLSVKMAGTFTADSSFTIGLSGKENEQITVLTSDGMMKPIASPDGTEAEREACALINDFFSTVKKAEIHFIGYQTNDKMSEDVRFSITYIDIDGQPMKLFDGKPIDIKAPVIGNVVLPGKVDAFKTGTAYVFDVDFIGEVFENKPLRSLVYRKKGAREWISAGVYDAGRIKDCRFSQVGTLEIAVKAVDLAGNVGYSSITEIEVVKDYEIVLDGEVPETGTTGTKIQLPGATATDKDGVEREVTISVENAYGQEMEMDGNSFTATEPGVYYIIYRSAYTEDGEEISTKLEYMLTVAQGSGTQASDEPGGGVGCGSVVSASCLLALTGMGIAIAVVATKKKKKDD